MKMKSFSAMRCSVAGALEIIGDRWTLLLLRDFRLGLTRFDEFQESMGISNTTLTDRLKTLETNGVIERVLYQKRPRRHEYRLTEKGRDLWKVTTALREWGDKWDPSGFGPPPIELVDRDTRHELQLALVDVETGAVVPRNRAEIRPGPGADEATLSRLQYLSRNRHG